MNRRHFLGLASKTALIGGAVALTGTSSTPTAAEASGPINPGGYDDYLNDPEEIGSQSGYVLWAIKHGYTKDQIAEGALEHEQRTSTPLSTFYDRLVTSKSQCGENGVCLDWWKPENITPVEVSSGPLANDPTYTETWTNYTYVDPKTENLVRDLFRRVTKDSQENT